MRILMVGDVVGRHGRCALKEGLPPLRTALEADAVIVNGENAAGGLGLTPETLRELFEYGADVVTSGNHIWKHRSLLSALENEPRLLRPANFPPGAPGRGCGVYTLSGDRSFAVINLQGRAFMESIDCPFQAADALLASLPAAVRVRCLDFHAEATSEKKALGWFLNGRASAVAGTHTHVQTNDPQILPGGTGYLTDLGMCGVEGSVLGVEPEKSIARFLTGRPHPYTLAQGKVLICGAVFDIEERTGTCRQVSLVRHQIEDDLPTSAREWRSK